MCVPIAYHSSKILMGLAGVVTADFNLFNLPQTLYHILDQHWLFVNHTGIYTHSLFWLSLAMLACATVLCNSVTARTHWSEERACSLLVNSTEDSSSIFVLELCKLLPVHVTNFQIAADIRNCTHSNICTKSYATASCPLNLWGWWVLCALNARFPTFLWSGLSQMTLM